MIGWWPSLRVTVAESPAPYLAFAVQGGDSQDQNLLQFFLNVVEFGMTVQQAVEAPNVNSYQMRSSFGRHESRPGRMTVASSLPESTREALKQMGVSAEIHPDYGYRGVRSYRVSTQKIERVLGFRPKVSVEESVVDIVEKIRSFGYTDFDNPRYYNIRWMKLLEEAHEVIRVTGGVFEAPAQKGECP